jgi:hypothetical protein
MNFDNFFIKSMMRATLLSLFFLVTATFAFSQHKDCDIILPSSFVILENEFEETNALWRIEIPCEAEKVVVQLINRWGKIIVETEDFNVNNLLEVDGTHIKPQVLFYKVSLEIDGELIEYQGNVKR